MPMRRTWIDIHNISVPENFFNSIGGNPLVSQILYQRGITDPDTARGFLIPDFYHPTSALDIAWYGENYRNPYIVQSVEKRKLESGGILMSMDKLPPQYSSPDCVT